MDRGRKVASTCKSEDSYVETMSGTLAVEAVNVSTTFGAAFIGLVVGSM